TPDRDGNNEEFLVKGTGILNSTFNMIIYDRWGKQVFQSNDVEKGWNGKINETTVADPAVFTWVVTYRDIDRKYHKYTGSLVLLR
ncbi:MAG TPA: gliding motility-associated C-terminal domain-containing protein, partial [Bacteroidales bacterium]|nr:gliding motility-associated C-terminal domain-containing protein [Bacteroidales bacterium]